MEIISDARKRLVALLILVGLHSYVVGLGLILMPVTALPIFGLEVVTEKFFPVQGGVFHVVMGTAYILSGVGLDRFRGLLLLTSVRRPAFYAFITLSSTGPGSSSPPRRETASWRQLSCWPS